MEFVIVGFAIVITLLIKLIYDEKRLCRKRVNQIKRAWGQVPDEEYTVEKFQSLRFYYDAMKDAARDVDDITWNDIDMDEIYMLLNNTGSAVGEEYLYAVLRKLQYDDQVLDERERLITYFLDHPDERLKLQLALSNMGKLRNVSFYQYINYAHEIEKKSSLPHYLYAGSLAGSAVLLGLSPALGISPGIPLLLLVFCIGNNMVQYYKRKAKIEKYFNVFASILRLLSGMKKICELDIPELDRYIAELREEEVRFRKFRKGASMVIGNNMGGSIIDVVMDYVRMIVHIDLIKFNHMVSEVQNNKEAINHIFETVGTLDSMIAIASFRVLIGSYSIPKLEKTTKPYLHVKEVFHPLIDNPVRNTINESRCVLITGSNASGKSTFIKTIAINAILSQTIHTSMAAEYKACYFKVYSSMALTDNIFGKESYYIVEIKSLKRILDQLEETVPTLCFVDEVLRGTNTLERIAASSRILESFSTRNAVCFAATHDIELTYILEKLYSNYHFQEQIQDDEILFDYKLYEGRAISRNAIKLLGIMGYQDEIIKEATEAANEFMEKGVWSPLNRTML